MALDSRNDALCQEVDRVLRQRNALLKQLGGRLDSDATRTLDVWDERLAECGDRLGRARSDVVARLGEPVALAYQDLAGTETPVVLELDAAWMSEGLAAVLATARRDDLRRGVSTIGPHRDDLLLGVAGLSARHESSQGEQRSLAFALRLAAHRLVANELGTAPTLLLDDVFSELDPHRSAALLRSLPEGQVILTSAVGLPAGSAPDLVLEVEGGVVRTL